jgi:outer membrane receptor protein involved in Fe transport
MAFHRSVLLGTTTLAGVAALALALPTAASAQAGDPLAQAGADPQGRAAAVTAEGEDAAEVDEIVVTGSRLRAHDLTSSSRVHRHHSVSGREATPNSRMHKRGPDIRDSDQSPLVTRAASHRPELRQSVQPWHDRTLTLVNGRRFVARNVSSIFSGAGAGGQVDLNAIPTALVARVDEVQATGGAVYGSDAVAGVINIITETEYEGLELNGEYGLSEQGDADNYRARITAGRNFLGDRVNLAGSYEYAETKALAFTDREVTARQIAFANNPENTGPADGIPGSILIQNRRIPETTQGGLPFRSNAAGTAANANVSPGTGFITIPGPNGTRVPAQFGPNGELVPYNPGTFFQSSIASGGDGLNLAELSSLQSPVKRHVGTLFGRFDLTDNLRLSGELFLNNTQASEPFNQPIYNAPLFGGTSSSLRFSTANPLLTAQARAALLAQPTPLVADPASPGDRIFFLSRASTDIGNNQTEAESDTYRGVLNLEGDFTVLNRDFFWNVAANHGVTSGTFQSPNIVQTRFLEAIDVIRDTNGAPVCRSVTARAAGCAPLDLFGFGRPSQAALNYVQVQFASEFEIKQTTYEANFGGSLLTLPAGDLDFNIGYEYRKEESSFDPNDPQETGVGRSAPITGLSGQYDTNEYYAEASVPVFGGDFSFLGARRLEFDGSYRTIENSQSGKDEAWSYGVRYYPIEDLLIRGTRSRSFRNPAITELFTPLATSFFTATTRATAQHRHWSKSGRAPSQLPSGLHALGLPQLQSDVERAGGDVQADLRNLDLQNEVADQYTWASSISRTLRQVSRFSIDYIDIELTQGISSSI